MEGETGRMTPNSILNCSIKNAKKKSLSVIEKLATIKPHSLLRFQREMKCAMILEW